MPAETWSILLEADTPYLRPLCALIQAEAPAEVKVYCLDAGQAPCSLSVPLGYLLAGCPTRVHEQHLPDAALGEAAGLPVDGTRILPVPAACNHDGEDLDVVLTARMIEVLEALEPAELDEELLERLCRMPAAEPWAGSDTWLIEAGRLATAWLNLPPSECEVTWQGSLGLQYRHLMSLKLWREGLMDREAGLRERAIQRWQAAPETAPDWAALLVMLLFKRLPAGFEPGSLPAWLNDLNDILPSLGRCLEILAPVKNFHVTVLLPTYNRVKLLKRAVAAIQAQTYADWTLIVADDCSSDETQAYLSAIAAEDPRVVNHRKVRNSGFNASMQELLERAETELVVNFTDDQFMYPHHLASCIALFRSHPWLACVGGSLHIELANGHSYQHGPYYAQAQVAETQRELERCGMICPLGPSSVYRKAVLRTVAPYDTWFCRDGQAYSPWDYLCNAKLLGHYEIGYVPEPLMKMLHADDGMSSRLELTADLLNLNRYVIEDYQALFERPYPLKLASYFGMFRFDEIQKRFTSLFGEAPDLETFRNRIAAQTRNWDAWVSFNRLQQACDPAAEPLIDMQNPYRGQGL